MILIQKQQKEYRQKKDMSFRMPLQKSVERLIVLDLLLSIIILQQRLYVA